MNGLPWWWSPWYSALIVLILIGIISWRILKKRTLVGDRYVQFECVKDSTSIRVDVMGKSIKECKELIDYSLEKIKKLE